MLALTFIILTLTFGVLTSIPIRDMLFVMFWLVGIDCIGCGMLVATFFWFIGNRFLLSHPRSRGIRIYYFLAYYFSLLRQRLGVGLLFRCTLKLFLSFSDNSSRCSTAVPLAHQRKRKLPAHTSRKQFLACLSNLLLVHYLPRLQVSPHLIFAKLTFCLAFSRIYKKVLYICFHWCL